MNEDTDDEEGNRPCLPLDKAKHKAPPTYSRKNPTQKKKENAAAVEEDEDANLFDSDLSSIHEDEIEDVPGFIDEDYIRSVQATKIIFLNATIKKCYGCDLYFEHKKMMPPWIWCSARRQKGRGLMGRADTLEEKSLQMLSSASVIWPACSLSFQTLRRIRCT